MDSPLSRDRPPGGHGGTPAIRALLRAKTIQWSDQLRTWPLPWETGIYPAEMAAFLALCDVTGAATIIESGRGTHAYSTQVLGEYADRTGVRVVSIDLDNDPARGEVLRTQLSRYRNVECLTGDIAAIFPDAAARHTGPIGLLMDGPKFFFANRLALLASIMFPVAAVAQHNCPPGMEFTAQFSRFFPGAYHYEDLHPESDPRWTAFKDWERLTVAGYEHPGGRSLSQSSMVLASLTLGRPSARALAGIRGVRAKAATLRTFLKWRRARSVIAGRGGEKV